MAIQRGKSVTRQLKEVLADKDSVEGKEIRQLFETELLNLEPYWPRIEKRLREFQQAERDASALIALTKNGHIEDFTNIPGGLVSLLAMQSIRSEVAHNAAKRERGDPLTKMIQGFVKKNPNISERELLKRLKNSHDREVIWEVDEKAGLITFMNKGEPESIPVTGLKDRLSRAKLRLKKKESR